MSDRRAILGATVGTIGLAAYLFVVGWIVHLVHFAAARLPATSATAALSYRELFGDGLRSTLLTAVGFAAACAVAYFTSARRWDVHGQDWHDIMRKRGVREAAGDQDAADERRRRERWHAQQAADRAGRVAARAQRSPMGSVARVATRIQSRRAARVGPAPVEPPKDLETAPLGDTAVRVVAGFNIMVLSGLIALVVARFIGEAIPIASWVGAVIGGLVFLLARWVLTRWSPLVLDARIHAIVWVAVAVGTLFASAPVGVLVLTAVGVATLGRSLARVRQPHSVADFLRSPLPWALLTVCLVLGLAFVAQPPVAFPRAVVTTASGEQIGGYVTRTRDGVYLATCTALADATSTNEHLAFVPAQEVRALRIGGGNAYFDSGDRPSIATLALRGLGLGGARRRCSAPTSGRRSRRARAPGRAACRSEARTRRSARA